MLGSSPEGTSTDTTYAFDLFISSIEVAWGSRISPFIPVPNIPSIMISALTIFFLILSRNLLPKINSIESIFSIISQFILASSLAILVGDPNRTTVKLAP